ncbi:MAG TPA: CHAT domain-containing protein [Blastocatellia bacterium]|nr:CHAT domain-containing protein [Blastocatellia bacterium]
MKALPGRLGLLAALFWLVAGAAALHASVATESARQLADGADDTAISLKDRQEALKKLTEAAQLFLDSGQKEEAARALNRAGRLQLLLNAPNDAINSHRQALTLLKPAAPPDVEVDSLNGMAAAYMLLQNRQAAQEALRRAFALSKQSAYTSGQAQALLILSDFQNYDNHVLALQTAQSALTLWQALSDKRGMARACSLIGRCYMAQNLLSDATQHYQTALQLWRELSNPPEEAAAIIMIAFIEQRKGEWENSLSLLTEAQALLDEEAEPQRMGEIAAGMAWAFHENGLPEISLAHYQRALDYFRRAQDIHMIWYVTWAIGKAHYLLNNYPSAVTYLQQALDQVAPDSITAAPCYEYLGRVYISTGQYEMALQNLEWALGIYTRTVNPMEAARVRGLLGQVSERQGLSNQARHDYTQALATFSKLSDRLNQAAIYYALGQLEFRSGNDIVAADYLRKSIAVTDDVRRASASSDLAAAFSATVYERYEKYIECLMHQYAARAAPALLAQAFETSELARARSLAELLRATQSHLINGLDPQLAEQEKSLRQALRVKEDYKVALLAGTYKTAELLALDKELAQLKAAANQVNESIRARYPAYEQMVRPAAWTLRQIQEQVIADDQTVLLEYSLGADKSYVWAVTRDHIQSYELPAGAVINAAAQEVYKLLASPPDPETEKSLSLAIQSLGRMILSPVAAELSKRRLLIVADGALHYLPFQVMPNPSAGDEPLVASYEIINIPSASILGELRKEARPRQAPKVLAAFGDPVFAANYALRKETGDAEPLAAAQSPDVAGWHRALRDIELNGDRFDPSVIKPLFYARRELANLREAANGREVFIASGFAATREQLLSVDLTQYAILHFATHGLLDPRRPENSGLVLSTMNRDRQAQNGFVGLQDIYGLRAPVGLVVLSACQTALGKDVRGEGLLGLTRGFMYAGASSVMASLWKVDDEATAELMRLAYINMLQKGMTPAAALRAAQNDIRHRPEWQSPYFWAGFTLQGEYLQAISLPAKKVTPHFNSGVILGGAVMLMASLALWYRHHRKRRQRQSP